MHPCLYVQKHDRTKTEMNSNFLKVLKLIYFFVKAGNSFFVSLKMQSQEVQETARLTGAVGRSQRASADGL